MNGGQVCEKLGPSLYDFLRKNSYRSFPVAIVREVAKQLLECLACVCTLLPPLVPAVVCYCRSLFHYFRVSSVDDCF
ncbi:unnamed protein product [Triticum turgidum subsp. durum]|uniref:Uncharacterized protein n=1 Tax=Triticum turgidum subsp. durum TaxID=4567 RepID=A0A9R1B047_TRITD|nr:unnamed protein product [Triticum turgidum subsp. durum]